MEKFLKDVYKFSGRLGQEKYAKLCVQTSFICIVCLSFSFLIGNFLEYNPEYKLLNSAYDTFLLMSGVLAFTI